jgi:hypothetical protein
VAGGKVHSKLTQSTLSYGTIPGASKTTRRKIIYQQPLQDFLKHLSVGRIFVLIIRNEKEFL